MVRLEQVEESPDVARIHLDRKAYATLAQSVPLVGGTAANALGYTGQGATVCVLDSGVDYSHPDLGDPACDITPSVIGTTEPYALESDHPYSKRYDYTWTITQPGYSSIAVHFQSIVLEEGYDFIYVLDADDTVVQSFTGSYSDTWSASVSGDTLKVRLVTDRTVNEWGFAIDAVLNGMISSAWSNCGSLVAGYDFVNGDDDPYDDNGHGTHVAGIIASRNAVYAGVAPGAGIIALKVLGADGSGSFSQVAAAIDWCIDNKDTYGISAITMSLGDGTEHNIPQTECDPYATGVAISAAVSQGIFVTAASGNDAFTDGINYPACASDAVSVGSVYDAAVGSVGWGSPLVCQDATTAADQLVCHTNRDELLDVLAPGALITSTVPGGGLGMKGGTSMAT
ncbi:S8 family serine peptidase, partial [Thermodesulfobacteriota bacterium]